MFKYLTVTILIILFAGLVIPQIALAGRFPFQGPLVPCGTKANPEKCGLCHFFELGQNIIDLLITIIVFLAPLMIVIGGIFLLTSAGVPERASQGKRIITYTIAGLALTFLAWTIINTILITLSGTDTTEKVGKIKGVPWPWNDIDCKPSSSSGGEEGGEEEGGSICRCEWSDGNVTTKEYSSPEECTNKCESYCSTPGGPPSSLDRYCCVEKATDECQGPIIGSEGNYCICEIPVYTVDPKKYFRDTEKIGTEFKGTELASEEECSQKCVPANANIYCPQRELTDEAKEGNFYCTSQNELENKTAHCIEMESKTESIGGNEACASSKMLCVYRASPGFSGTEKEYVDKCWIDGQFLCTCTDGQARWCPSSRPHGLYRTQRENEAGTMLNAWDCIGNCGKYVGERCRLGHFWGGGEEEVTWRFQGDLGGTKDQQVADASTALKNFLDCFYQKAPSNIGYISAITDKDIYNGTCNPQDCKSDTCTVDNCGAGNPCDHACHSCHYGGTCSTTKSYAVDFGDEGNVCKIADTALKCGGVKKIFGPQSCGGKVTVDGHHNDHVHISVINSCNCQ